MARNVLVEGVLKARPMILGRSPRLNPPRGLTQKDPSLQQLKRIRETSAPNICIVRSLGGVGDVLMVTPSLRALRYEWPKAQITFATDYNYLNGALVDLMANNPYINGLISYHAVEAQGYDTKIDVTSCCLQYEKPKAAAFNRIDIFAQHIGVSLDATGRKPDYFVSPEEMSWAKRKLQLSKNRPNQIVIGVQPRSAAQSRSWNLDKVRQLVALLSQNPLYKVIVFDFMQPGSGDREMWNLVKVEPCINFGLRQVGALVNEVDFMVTPDSGLMHLAAAVDTPGLAVFGGTDPAARINHYPGIEAVSRSDFACFPCWYDSSPCKTQRTCLDNISVDQVFNQVNEMVNNLSNKPKTTIADIVTVSEPIIIKMEKEPDFCIVRDDGIGDLVACLPAFSAFRKKHKDKTIALATYARNTELMELSGCFDKIIPMYKKAEKIESSGRMYDCRDLFEKNKDEEKVGCYHETESRPKAMAHFLDVEPDENYKLSGDLAANVEVQKLLVDSGIDLEEDKIVTLQLDATCKARSWIKKYFKPLFKLLNKAGYIPVLLGSRLEGGLESYFHCVNLTGRTSIAMFNALIRSSAAFIGVDSGGVHLAAANGIPFVAMFNAIDPKLRLEDYKNYCVIYPESLKCAPCWDEGCVKMSCMRLMTPEVVMGAFERLLSLDEDSHYWRV